jgi:NitT/TauT family transport system substrate-binding protein
MKKINLAILVLSLTLIVFTLFSFTYSTRAVQDPLQTIYIRLPIPVVDSAFNPYYVAIDQGFYEKEGLKVILQPGTAETNPIKMVLAGKDKFGVIGGPDTLLVARSKDLPVVAIATLHKNSNFPVLLTLKDSGLTTLEDLQNKKIGFFYGHISTDVLRNLLRKENIDYEEVNVGFNYKPLIAGTIDASWAFHTTAGLNLPHQGIEVNTISPKDYGIVTHGHTIFTTDDFIEKNPEIVEKFLRATIKGIKFTTENPHQAILSTLSRDLKINPELEKIRLAEYNKVTSNSKQFPPGYMDYKMFKETYDRLNQEKVLASQFDVNNAFTTEFLNKI